MDRQIDKYINRQIRIDRQIDKQIKRQIRIDRQIAINMQTQESVVVVLSTYLGFTAGEPNISVLFTTLEPDISVFI